MLDNVEDKDKREENYSELNGEKARKSFRLFLVTA